MISIDEKELERWSNELFVLGRTKVATVSTVNRIATEMLYTVTMAQREAIDSLSKKVIN